MNHRIEVVPGPGAAIRYGSVTVWVGHTASNSLLEFLIHSARNVGADEAGAATMCGHIADILGQRDPEAGAPFAVVGPDGDQWATLLHGPVQLWDGTAWSAPTPNPGWLHKTVTAQPALAIGPAGTHLPRLVHDSPFDFDRGVVPGGGIILVPLPGDQGGTQAEGDAHAGHHPDPAPSPAGSTAAAGSTASGGATPTTSLDTDPTPSSGASPAGAAVVGLATAGAATAAGAGGAPTTALADHDQTSALPGQDSTSALPEQDSTSALGDQGGTSVLPGDGGTSVLPQTGSAAADPTTVTPADSLVPDPLIADPFAGAGRGEQAGSDLGVVPDRSRSPMVDGRRCAAGHFNHPYATTCPICGASVPVATVSDHRPNLGLLLADDGSVYRLDKDQVIGNAAEDASAGPSAASIALVAHQQMAPVHTELRLDGWEVMVVDRGHTAGTFLYPPGASGWQRLTAYQPVKLTDGTHLSAGGRVLTFLSRWPA